MKKFISLLSFALLLCSCEKAPINLTDENIELRLESMVGENISAVGNSLKAEGFQKFDFDNQTNYIKGTETYLLKESKKTVVSAGYQLSDSTKAFKLFNKYHFSFDEKKTENYSAEIYATNFNDWSKSYVDSIKINNNEYIYIYDNPTLFYSAIQVNSFNLVYASENWWNGEKNKEKMWNVQLGEKAKITCITYSDFSIIE